MNSIKKGSGSEGLNGKLAYEPPKAMRLDDMREGAGDCISSGSGDGYVCDAAGNSAAGCYGGNNGPE